MPQETISKVLDEKKKSLIMALLAWGYNELWVAFILQMSKTAVHKNKVKQKTLETKKIQTGRGQKLLN